MKKNKFLNIVAVLAVFMAACLFVSIEAPANNDYHTLTILHTNDVHGRLQPINYGEFKNVGGFASRAKLVKEIKSENENVLTLDGGDFAQGTMYFKFFSGLPEAKFMSKVGYDAIELGNHEFDKGIPTLQKIIEASKTPVLCANIEFLHNQKLQNKIKPYVIKKYNGFNVLVIGVIAEDLKVLTGDYKNFEVKPPAEKVSEIIKNQGSNADLIVVLSHEGVGEDLKLAKAVPEINIIVGGHSHTFLKQPEKVFHGKTYTLIAQSGEFGVDLGKMDIEFANKEIKTYKYEQILVDGSKQDKYFAKKTNKLTKKINKIASQKIGEVGAPIDVRKDLIKKQLTNGGAFVLKAIKEKFPQADVVIINSGSIRSNKIIDVGALKKSDIFELYPFDDSIVLTKITGAELKSVLETSSSGLPRQSGCFLQTLGINYSVNTQNQPQIVSGDGLKIVKYGNRVSDVKINGKTLENEKYYTIATNDFVSGGGDGFSQFNRSVDTIHTKVPVQTAIIDFVKKYSPVEIQMEDKINLY